MHFTACLDQYVYLHRFPSCIPMKAQINGVHVEIALSQEVWIEWDHIIFPVKLLDSDCSEG